MRKSQQFPEDVLVEILLRLQVVDLLRFKSVCKGWNCIISSPNFIQLHLKKSIGSPSHHWILMPYPNTLKTINCNDVYDEEIVIKDFPRPFGTEATFLGSDDGLMSFYSYKNKSICVWNPAIRVSKTLKTAESFANSIIAFSWFGHGSSDDDDDDDEYKLVIGTLSKKNRGFQHYIHLIRPYADEDCDWKSTQKANKEYYFVKELGTLFNGRVHWPALDVSVANDATSVVFSYDLRRETIAEVPPYEGMDHSASMCVLNGYLSAIQTKTVEETLTARGEKSVLTVWMMKEYGVKESWTKFAVLSGIYVPSSDGITILSSFLVGVTDKGDWILNVGGSEVLLYNMEEKKSQTLMANGHGRAIMYVESLVFPQLSKRGCSQYGIAKRFRLS